MDAASANQSLVRSLCASRCAPTVEALLDVATSKKAWLETQTKADDEKELSYDVQSIVAGAATRDALMSISKKASNHIMSCLESAAS